MDIGVIWRIIWGKKGVLDAPAPMMGTLELSYDKYGAIIILAVGITQVLKSTLARQLNPIPAGSEMVCGFTV